MPALTPLTQSTHGAQCTVWHSGWVGSRAQGWGHLRASQKGASFHRQQPEGRQDLPARDSGSRRGHPVVAGATQMWGAPGRGGERDPRVRPGRPAGSSGQLQPGGTSPKPRRAPTPTQQAGPGRARRRSPCCGRRFIPLVGRRQSPSPFAPTPAAGAPR